MMKYFVRKIILVNMIFLYSTVSYTESRHKIRLIARNQTTSYVINNFKKLTESKIIETIKHDPIEKHQVLIYILNNIKGFIKLEGFIGPYSGEDLIKEIIKDDPIAKQQVITYIVNNLERSIQ